MMNFNELSQTIDELIENPMLTADFDHVAVGNWIRHKDRAINLVQLQKHTIENLFCVNIGIHYTFLPGAGTECPLDYNKIEYPDCELKLRLTESIGEKDQWWSISVLNAKLVSNLILKVGLNLFDSYHLNGNIVSMDGHNVESGNLGLLASMTRVRACLLLARMHEDLGNYALSAATAKIGIELAGMAVGPKKALKDILKRVEEGA